MMSLEELQILVLYLRLPRKAEALLISKNSPRNSQVSENPPSILTYISLGCVTELFQMTKD